MSKDAHKLKEVGVLQRVLFAPEEFQKLDFSKIDLSEFIADIVGSIDVDKIQAYFIKIQKN
nr:hypothetical protein [Campylobacter jejuni]